MKRFGLLLIFLSACAVVMGQGANSRLRYDKEKDLNGISMEPILLSMHEDYDPMDCLFHAVCRRRRSKG